MVYSNTMSSALLSLKPAEMHDQVVSENAGFSQGILTINFYCYIEKDYGELKGFNKIQSTSSPPRVQTAVKGGSRKERLRQAKNNLISQNRNTNQNIDSNNAFFITQSSKEKRSRGKSNKSVVGDIKTTSFRKMGQHDDEPLNLTTQQPEIIDKIAQNKFMTDKDIKDIHEIELDKKYKNEGRNNVEEYWKINPISIESKNEAVYKSSDNITTEKFLHQDEFKKQQHHVFKKYVEEKVDE